MNIYIVVFFLKAVRTKADIEHRGISFKQLPGAIAMVSITVKKRLTLYANQTMAEVGVPEPPFPSHNILDYLLRLWYRVFQYRIAHNDISCQVDSFLLFTSRGLQFHRFTAAAKLSLTGACYYELRATLLADISFANLCRHLIVYLLFLHTFLEALSSKPFPFDCVVKN